MNLSLKTLGPDPGDSKALQWNLSIKETWPFKQSKEKLNAIFV